MRERSVLSKQPVDLGVLLVIENSWSFLRSLKNGNSFTARFNMNFWKY